MTTRTPRWLAYRSAPYAWERMLLWLFIVVCFGIDAGARLVGAIVPLLSP